MRNSLRGRLIGVFIGLSTLPLILVGAVLAWRSYTVQQAQALDLQRQVAQRVAADVRAFMRERENELYLLTTRQELQALDQEQQSNALNALLSSVYKELTLVSKDGREQARVSLVAAVDPSNFVNRAGQDVFERPKVSDEIYYSPVQFEQETGTPFMTIAIPLVNARNGEFDGVLAADLYLETVWNRVVGEQMAQGSVYVVDPGDRVVAHHDPGLVSQGVHWEPPQRDGFYAGLDGAEAAIAVEYVRLGAQELGIVAELPASEALTLARSTKFIIFLALVGAFVLSVLAGIAASRSIARPSETLVTSAQASAEGDLSRRDAIGNLGGAFQLRVAAEIAGQLGAILDPELLLQEAVSSLQARFGLYHVHIYLLESPPMGETEGGALLVVRAGSGEVGRALVERGHSILLGWEKSLVARAAREQAPVMVNDTSLDSDFLPNPLLPQTLSELSVPLVVGERVLGVLDVQDDRRERFSLADVDTFSTLAGQIATSLQTADLFGQVERNYYSQETLKRLAQISLEEARLQDLLDQALDVIIDVPWIKVLPQGGIFLTAAGSEALVLQAQRNLNPQVKTLCTLVPFGKCLCGRAAATGEVQFADCIDERHAIHAEEMLAHGHYCVPIVAEGRVVGVLFLYLEHGHERSEDEVAFLQAVARTLGGIITRKQAQDALRQEEERFRTVADFTYAWEYWMAPDKSFVYVSPACEKITGYSVQEFMDDPDLLDRIVHPDDVEQNSPRAHGDLEEGQVHETEFRVIARDGQERWISHVCQPVYSSDGEHLGRRASNRDITQRRRVEEDLRRERARTDELFAISRELNQAGSEEELLWVLAQPGLRAGATQASLHYIDVRPGAEGEPEWLELVAAWQRGGEPVLSVGTRHRVSDYTFSTLWLTSPDEPQFITNTATDECLDENAARELSQAGLCAIALIPLHQAGLRERSAERRWVGLFTLGWSEPHRFGSQETGLYRALGRMATPAVANRRLLVEQERALTVTLYCISSGLTTAGDNDELLRVLVQPAIEAGISSASLMYVDVRPGEDSGQAGEPEWLEIVALWWRDESQPPMPIRTRYYVPDFCPRLWIDNPGKIHLLDDVATDERLDENTRGLLAQMGLRAVALIPLTQVGLRRELSAERRWVGLLTLNWDEPHQFSQQEREIYNALIGLASPAVASRRLFQQTQVAREQAERLYRAGRRINEAEDLQGIVAAALEEVRMAVINRAVLLCYEHDAAGQVQAALVAANWHSGQGTPPTPPGVRYPAAVFRDLGIFAGPRTVLFDDIQHNERMDAATLELMQRQNVYAMAALPLRVGARQLGALLLQAEEVHHFTEDEMRPFRSLARQVAAAVDAQNLFQQTQQALAETSALYRASQAINVASTLDEVLRALVDGLDLPHLVRVDVSLFNRPWIGDDAPDYAETAITWDRRAEEGGSAPGDYLEMDMMPTAWQTQADEVVILGDLQTDPRLDEASRQFFLDALQVRGAAFLPLVASGQWIGVVSLFTSQELEIDDAHLRRVRTLSAQAAAVVQGLQRLQQTQAVLDRTDVLYGISNDLNTATSEVELLQALARPAIQAGAFSANLMYVQIDGSGRPEWLEVVASWGQEGELETPPGMHIYLPELSSSRLWINNPDEPLLISDAASDGRLDENMKEQSAQAGVRALAIIPLNQAGRWVGLLTLNWDAPHMFSEREAETYRALIGLGSPPIESRRQFERTREAREQAETLFGISHDLNAALDEYDLLLALVWPTMHSGVSEANLFYLDLDEQDQPEWLEMVAAWQQQDEPKILPGTRYYLPEYPFAQLYLDNPDEPLLVPDVTQSELVDEHLRERMVRMGTHAFVTIPLNQAGRWVGLVVLHWDEPHEFSEAERELYRAFVGPASAAVDSRRSFERTRVARRQAETLYSISSGLSAARDVDELLQALRCPAQEAGAFRADLTYMDLNQAGEPEWLEIVAVWQREGEPLMPVGARYYLPDLPFARLWLDKPDEPLLLVNAATDERVDENVRTMMEQAGTCALVVIPLVQAERWVGNITFTWDEPHEFGQQELALYRALLGLATPAVAGRRLMDRLELMVNERTEQIRTASDISGRVNAILDPDLLLSEVTAQLQDRFNLYHVHVFLLDEDRRELVAWAGSGEAGRALQEDGLKISMDYEHSLIARAARSREIVLANDVAAHPDYMPYSLLPETRAELTIPLVTGERLLGVFDVQARQVNRFSHADQDVFSAIAGQVSIALENARRFDQAQARLRVGQTLIGAQTEEQVLDAMLRAVELYPLARVVIYIFDPRADEQTLVLRRDEVFESGLKATLPLGARVPVSQLHMPYLLSPDAPFVMHNVLMDERVHEAARELARRSGTKSVVIMPIVAGDEWLGAIMGWSRQEGYFDRRKLYLYQSLADQGAIFVRTARLFDETQETAERLRELDRLKNEFMASMSHELRTPLNAVLGFAEVLLMGISGDLSPEAQVDVQAILDNGQSLLRIVDDVLDLSKMEAGTLSLTMESVEIAPLLRQVWARHAALLADKEVGMRLQVEDDLPQLEADPARVEQIVDNLVSNAIKFTEQGRIVLRAFEDEAWLCLEVQDTGLGIDEAHQEIIFESFRQVDGSHARRVGGMGLGLAITRRLVELHGGTIEVHSRLGEGSTFSVRLPMSQKN